MIEIAQERSFVVPEEKIHKAWLLVLLGVVLIAVTIGGFFLSLRANSNMIGLMSMTWLPAMGAIGAFFSAFRTLKAPRQVMVNEQVLTVVNSANAAKAWTWDQIALVRKATVPVSSKAMLKVYTTGGGKVPPLTDDLEDFADLVTIITERARGQKTPAGVVARRRKLRQVAAYLMIGGVFAWALSGVNVWTAHSKQGSQRLLAEQGQPASAVVIDKFIAPDGRTCRVNYRVVATGDVPIANVQVQPAVWILIKRGQTLPVIAVPDRPDISHLASGEIDDHFGHDPKVTYGVSAIVALMGILFFVVGMVQWVRAANPEAPPLKYL